MRKLLFALGLLFAGSFALSGCKDKCDKPCIEGNIVDCDCVCEAGFEGSYCHRWWTKKFTSDYIVTITCPDTNDINHGRVYSGFFEDRGPTDPTNMLVWNIAASTTHAIVTMTDSINFVISPQPDVLDPSVTYTGSGFISPDYQTVTMNYEVADTSGVFSACTATFVKVPRDLPIFVE